jgi:ribulose-phosphate 3-epimerase
VTRVWSERARESEIEPSLYTADLTRLGEQIRSLMDAGALVFHFDVGDGRFIEPITLGPIVLDSIAPMIEARGGCIDCHLMTVEPENHFRQIARAGGHSVTFHVEACDDPPRAVALARELELGVGIAFNPETSVETALAAAEGVDLVLCMSIHPGYSGQEFMPEALGRISALRAALPDDVVVQVDGGISAENVAEVHAAGAGLVVAGSSIFGAADVAAAYVTLAAELERAQSLAL